ncbi:MAG: hypothetical protein OEO77_11710 [Acidimicrobiia bacterium]|nr:hypothetical protein [Acidimicrobiia bacterium]
MIQREVRFVETVVVSEPSTRVLAVLRDISRGGLAGVVAGIVAAGIGGRAVMRLSFLIDPGTEGLRTENGFRIGQFTASGTIELIIFGGLFSGLVVGVVWVIVRDFLPVRGRVGWAALAAVAIGGFNLIETDNPDFDILDPVWAHVLILLGLIALIGALTALTDRWLDRHLPTGARNRPAALVVYGIITLLGANAAVLTFASFFSSGFCFCEDPPWLTGTGLLVAAAAFSSWAITRITAPDLPRPTGSRLAVGRFGVALAVVAGVAHLIGRIAQIV